jgi:alkane 1-monooxygenase
LERVVADAKILSIDQKLDRNEPSPAGSISPARRWLWLLGVLPPALPVLGFCLVRATGLSLFWWLGPLFVYGFVATVDLVFGPDKTSYALSEIAAVEGDSYYRWVACLVMPIQYASLIWSVWMLVHGGLGFVDSLGLTVTLGISNGIAIANAHELGHKSELLERVLAKFVLAPSFFGHFNVEHNGAHHVWAATPEDFSSARMGESFYAFFPRTLIGGVNAAWRLEKRRLARRGQSPWTWRNDALNAWAISFALFGGLFLWLGWRALPWLLLQAFIGQTMLQMINYLQHYGLLRDKRADGRYERCAPRHSWNSSHPATNILLYRLPRHSDHHSFPMRRYHALRHFEEAPQLPTGYAGMSLITLLPFLWRRMIDPILVAHAGGDLSKINIEPSKRAQILLDWSKQSRSKT